MFPDIFAFSAKRQYSKTALNIHIHEDMTKSTVIKNISMSSLKYTVSNSRHM